MSKKIEEVRDPYGYKVGVIEKYKNNRGMIFFVAKNEDGEVHFKTEKAARAYLLDASMAFFYDISISSFLSSELS
jgi:hypothetical protein